jgi:hypothetical protein
MTELFVATPAGEPQLLQCSLVIKPSEFKLTALTHCIALFEVHDNPCPFAGDSNLNM